MGSNVFINYSLMGINVAYKVFGKKLTNFAIENTAASLFTGGVTVADMTRDTTKLEENGIGGIGCYVVEGVRDAKNSELDQFLDFTIESIKDISQSGAESHFALKLTAFISTDLMEKLNLAQHRFVNEILQVNFEDHSDDSVLSEEQLVANLAAVGITNFSK